MLEITFSVLLLIGACRCLSEIPIDVLFASDMDSSGRIAVEMAAEYINAHPTILPNHSLKLQLDITSDASNFRLIRRACQSTAKGVAILIGPNESSSTKTIVGVPQGMQVPQISPFATDPFLSSGEYPYLFKMSSPDWFQSSVIQDLAWKFAWTRFSIIASNNEYGRNGLHSFMQYAAAQDWIISSVEYFNPATYSTTSNLQRMLQEIKAKGARIIILNCYSGQAKIILEHATRMGMLNAGWAWIATDAITAMGSLFNECTDAPLHLRGLLGTRPSYGKGELFTTFQDLWKKKTASNKSLEVGTNCTDDLAAENCVACEAFSQSILDMRIMDAILATAYALHAYLSNGHELNITSNQINICDGPMPNPWANGPLFRDSLKQVDGPGIMNHLSFTSLQYPGVNSYEVVNLVDEGWVPIGNWSPYQRIPLPASDEVSNLYLVGDPVVIFPGAVTDVPIDTVIDMSNVTLKVVTIIEPPFVEYTTNEERLLNPNIRLKGLCIDLLDIIKGSLGFQYEIHLVADGNYGTQNALTREWNGLMGDLVQGGADMCMAPLTITYERQQFVKFTKPFMDLGVNILVAKEVAKVSIMGFLEPFEWSLWAVVIGTFIFVGLCLTFCSYFSPYGHRGAYIQREDLTDLSGRANRNQLCLKESLWVSFAAWMQQGAEFSPRSLSGRFAQGTWWFTVMVISATYTANLAAFLTVARLDSGINSLNDLANQREIKYGTVKNSAVQKFFDTQVSDPYVKMAGYMAQEDSNVDNATFGFDLVRGERHEDFKYAFIFDSAILEYVASNRPCSSRIASEIFNQFGYGVAFPKSSPYVDLFSLQILRLRENGSMESLIKRWVTSGSCLAQEEASSTTSDQITISTLLGVFTLLGAGLGISLILAIVEFCVASHREDRKRRQLGEDVAGGAALKRRMAAICSDLHTLCCCCCPHPQPEHEPHVPQKDQKSRHVIQGHTNMSYDLETNFGGFIMKRPQLNGDFDFLH